MKIDRWWTWNWDRRDIFMTRLNYDHVIRWRRGWFTLYKTVDTKGYVEWRLYLPFNISIGIQL